MIPQRNISLLSNRLAQAGRRIREDVLARDYCLAWFLAVLAESDLKGVLAFKGGTALKCCYVGDYRFSEDLDFTLVAAVPLEEILGRLGFVYARIREESGIAFAFDREDRLSHLNSYTFYLKYEGPLPAGNDVKVDITIREHLAFPLNQRVVLRAYPEFADIPEGRSLQVYALEEIATEKVLALGDSARTEPRDLYDLWYLTSQLGVELTPLIGAIQQKLEFRERLFGGIGEAILRKEARFRALWSTRLSHQMVSLPLFEEVFREMRRALRQANLL